MKLIANARIEIECDDKKFNAALTESGGTLEELKDDICADIKETLEEAYPGDEELKTEITVAVWSEGVDES